METEEVIEEEVTVVEGEEVVFEDGSSLPFQYDGVFNLTQERNLLYDLYQPEETATGTFVCKICLRTGKEMEFTERNSFVAHRYKCHGSYNNTVLCPVDNCREVFASLTTLRKHMSHSHNLPLEVHQQAFGNIGEFERWRHLLELSSGCRFMMHTKQPKLRRQVMHCSKSEHKLVLQTNKHRLPRLRMSKEGSCCPAHISFRIDAKTGEVHSFAQLYHIGHTPNNDEPSTNLTSISPSEPFRPTEVHFPPKQRYYGEKPMQYIQIDLYEMCTAIYNASIYETVLLITDLKTGYLWARALTDCSRSVITRILTSIFTEFGIPEGYSTCYSPTFIRDSMKSIEMVFDAEIREVWNEPPPYEEFEQWLMTVSSIELNSSNRWVEQLQFLVMEYNQRAPVDCISPFERMFGRKPPRDYPDFEDEEDEEETSNIIGRNKEKYYKKTRPSELEQELEPIPIAYQAGEKVYLRRVLRKPGRGMNSPYIYGYIAEVDLDTPHFPYKVHYSSTDSPWPSEVNIYAWMSSNDILPTAHKVRDVNEGERSYSIKKMFCTCSGVESSKYDCSSQNMNWKQYASCPLYQNIVCANKMSLFCCKVEGRLNCPYHNYYPLNDDSYVKLEMALVSYKKLTQDKHEKQTPNMLQNVSFQYNKSYPAAPTKKVAAPAQSSAGEPPIKISKTETRKTVSPPPAPTSAISSPSQPSEQQQQEPIEEEEPEQSQVEPRSKASSETPSEKRRQSGRKAKPKAFDDYIA